MDNIVVGMGEVLWDILPEGKKIGGAPANFAYHISQFGLDSCVVSAADDLKKQGYEFVTIEQLIKMAGDAGDTGDAGN